MDKVPMNDYIGKPTIAAICLTGALLAGTAVYCNKKEEMVFDLGMQNSYTISLDMESLIGSLCDDGHADNAFYKELASLKNDNGTEVFNCKEIVTFKEQGGEVGYARELAKLRDVFGNNFFYSGYDITAFHQAGGSVEYAQKFVADAKVGNHLFSGDQLVQFYALQLEVKDIVLFDDTSKPNSLLVYPARDNNAVFRMPDSVNLYNNLKIPYDLKVVVASTEDQLYAELDPRYNFEFFMTSGHGTKTTLQLGDQDPRKYSTGDSEIYSLDTDDDEYEMFLQNLHPQAVIFLNSCSTGEGGLGADNLANYVAMWANGRKVIAAQDVLWNNKINVVSMYPFDAQLQDGNGEKDITYRTFHFNIFSP